VNKEYIDCKQHRLNFYIELRSKQDEIRTRILDKIQEMHKNFIKLSVQAMTKFLQNTLNKQKLRSPWTRRREEIGNYPHENRDKVSEVQE
jgi:hypothetical protein